MSAVTLVDVGMRDGFQSVDTFIPTETKIEILKGLYGAGVRRFEATSSVSPRAVPQLADSPEVIAATNQLADCDAQVLVPTARHGQRALDSGARKLAFVMSVSQAHNLSNVKQTPEQSIDEFRTLMNNTPPGVGIRLNVATAFDCPFDGPVDHATTLAVLAPLVQACPTAEIALCDTTGRVTPDRVRGLFELAMAQHPEVEQWVFHGHDTYGMGMANVFAAWESGVRIFDASVAGLGGCPFAPGATGNVATEDLVYMFEHMGVETGIDLSELLRTAALVASLPGARTGGRVRQVMSS